MQKTVRIALVSLTCAAFAAVAVADGTATLSVSSSKAGTAIGSGVAAGSDVDWTISVDLTGVNEGLALVACDLVQDPNNPTTVTLAPGAAAAGMEQFDAPNGIVNPAGFGGTPIGDGLVQVGGAQNTFGEAGTGGLGEDPNIAQGVGVGGQAVATGSFAAPATEGVVFTYSIANGLATVLDSVAVLPNYSPVSSATVAYGTPSFSIIVRPLGDCNCDGVTDTYDIDAFVTALTGAANYEAAYPGCDINLADTNADDVVDTYDIDSFVALLAGS